MRYRHWQSAAFFCLLWIWPCSAHGQALTDDSVIQMAQWKVSPAEITATIKRNGNNTNFDLTAGSVRKLKAAGITSEVLTAMLQAMILSADSSVADRQQIQMVPASATAAPLAPIGVDSREPKDTTGIGTQEPRTPQSDTGNSGSASATPQTRDATKPRLTFEVPSLRPEDVAQTSQSVAAPNTKCANLKDLPALLGVPIDGQDKLVGCTGYNVASGHIASVVLVEVSKADQVLPCNDLDPKDFSLAVRTPVTLDSGQKYGSFVASLPTKLKSGEGVCLLEAYVENGVMVAAPSSSAVIVSAGFRDVAPLGEALVGIDVSAASSAPPQGVLLALATFDLPLEHLGDFSTARDLGVNPKKPLWVSGELGLKGIAQPGPVSGVVSPGYFASAANATPDKIVQSIDASMHLGWQFHTWHVGIGTFDSGTSQNTSATQASDTFATLSFIGGGGAATPLSVSQITPQVFEATPLIIQTQKPVSPFNSFAPSCSANPAAAPTCYVIFLPSDRTRFYRSYDVGLRLKLYAKDLTDNELRFPAILNLTVGQNEYVTGGKLRAPVLHLGGSFPFPRLDSVYVFGNFDLALSSSGGGGPQLQLIPAPATAGVTSTSPSVYTILTTQPNRDRYEIGFGIDVFHLFAKYFTSSSKAQPQEKN